jgi:hypothetical protein
MAKKQTRRSISVSRTTYERLKAFCETNNISMSQLVETRVNDFLGDAPAPAASVTGALRPMTPRPASPGMLGMPGRPLESRPGPAAGTAPSTAGSSSLPGAPASSASSSGSPGSSASSSGSSGPSPSSGSPPAAPSAASSSSHQGAAHHPHPSMSSAPMTSAAARFAVDPPLPIIKPRQETAAPKPAEKRPEQIFTF